MKGGYGSYFAEQNSCLDDHSASVVISRNWSDMNAILSADLHVDPVGTYAFLDMYTCILDMHDAWRIPYIRNIQSGFMRCMKESFYLILQDLHVLFFPWMDHPRGGHGGAIVHERQV